MAADEPGGARRTSVRNLRNDRALDRSHVGDEWHARVEELNHRIRDGTDRQRDERDVGAGRGRLQVVRDRSQRAQLEGTGEPVAVAVEPDDVVSELGEGQPERATDQAGADYGDAHDYSGRSSRRVRAPSRYTGWRSARF